MKAINHRLRELSFRVLNQRPINPYELHQHIARIPSPGVLQLIDSLEEVIRDKSKLRR